MTDRVLKEESRVMSFADYDRIVNFCRGVSAKRVLEFGPGASTLALTECDAEFILTCEYDSGYYEIAKRELAAYPTIKVVQFTNDDRVLAPMPEDKIFDVAFVDSPVGQGSRRAPLEDYLMYNRLNTCLYAVLNAEYVLLHDARRWGENNTLQFLSKLGCDVGYLPSEKGLAVIRGRKAFEKYPKRPSVRSLLQMGRQVLG